MGSNVDLAARRVNARYETATREREKNASGESARGSTER